MSTCNVTDFNVKSRNTCEATCSDISTVWYVRNDGLSFCVSSCPTDFKFKTLSTRKCVAVCDGNLF